MEYICIIEESEAGDEKVNTESMCSLKSINQVPWDEFENYLQIISIVKYEVHGFTPFHQGQKVVI